MGLNMAGKRLPGQAITVAGRLKREDRRREVARHLLAGRSLRETARLLGVSHVTISNDYKIIRDQWRKQYAMTMDQLAQQETARYDAALMAIWPAVEKGHLESIDRFLKLSQARRELLGLDAPRQTYQRVEVTERVSAEDLDRKISRLITGMEASDSAGSADTGRA